MHVDGWVSFVNNTAVENGGEVINKAQCNRQYVAVCAIHRYCHRPYTRAECRTVSSCILQVGWGREVVCIWWASTLEVKRSLHENKSFAAHSSGPGHWTATFPQITSNNDSCLPLVVLWSYHTREMKTNMMNQETRRIKSFIPYVPVVGQDIDMSQ